MAGVTPKQVALFTELVDRTTFPAGTDTTSLLATFGTLSRKAASEWIDKALTLPNATDAEDTGVNAPAPF